MKNQLIELIETFGLTVELKDTWKGVSKPLPAIESDWIVIDNLEDPAKSEKEVNNLLLSILGAINEQGAENLKHQIEVNLKVNEKAEGLYVYPITHYYNQVPKVKLVDQNEILILEKPAPTYTHANGATWESELAAVLKIK
ncbi:hypothetical protein [Streptococcus jiangjianxini]|uniref:hypothetical protein n=1 Tax=Streptococcus jiangjianxini TaxID=3161189 RepID=UPI0032EFE47B